MATDEPISILTVLENPRRHADYVLPSMMAGTIGALISPGGVGKSMLAWQLATQIAGGPDLLGIGKLPTGRVVYLPSEDLPIAIEERIHALGAHWSREERHLIDSNVLIHPLRNSCRDIMSSEGHDRLLQFASGRRLMLLDTLRRFHNEEENASASMNLLISRLEDITFRTGCAIVFLHHANKGVSLSGNGDQQQASRGSSVLTDNVRWQAYLAGMTKDDAQQLGVDESQRGHFVRFGLSKVNYGPPFQERWLRRHNEGVLKSAVLERTSNRERGSREEF